jgi:hypothetical protein
MHRQSLKSVVVVGTLVLLGMLFFMPLLFSVMNPYDEGNVLCGAMRVCRGEVSYRSFWSCYAPGQFYTMDALFSIFGESASLFPDWRPFRYEVS